LVWPDANLRLCDDHHTIRLKFTYNSPKICGLARPITKKFVVVIEGAPIALAANSVNLLFDIIAHHINPL
jgi:hypothetical protein